MRIISQVYSFYNFDCVSEDEMKIVVEHFSSPGNEVTVEGLHVKINCNEVSRGRYSISDTDLDSVLSDWKDIASALGRSFSVYGCIDTSFVAGEYMDFCLEYRNGEFIVRYSDWYEMGDLFMYANYADFCEEFGKICSDEEFDALKNELTYIIHKEDGYILTKVVPLEYVYDH